MSMSMSKSMSILCLSIPTISNQLNHITSYHQNHIKSYHNHVISGSSHITYHHITHHLISYHIRTKLYYIIIIYYIIDHE